jgi:hypothetical protein
MTNKSFKTTRFFVVSLYFFCVPAVSKILSEYVHLIAELLNE